LPIPNPKKQIANIGVTPGISKTKSNQIFLSNNIPTSGAPMPLYNPVKPYIN
jgi:hypothetical protein